MKNALKEVVSGFNSLVTGLRITLGQFFKPIVTVQYPHQTLKIPPRFRGHIELVLDPETGKPKCFACKLCERACPSDCITVEGAKLEGAKKRSVTAYRLDFTKCSLCGSCVEACRDGAIRFSRDYNLAATSKEEFIMDLFHHLEVEAQASGLPSFQTPPTPTAAAEKSGAAAAPASPAANPAASAPKAPAKPAPVIREPAPGKAPEVDGHELAGRVGQPPAARESAIKTDLR